MDNRVVLEYGRELGAYGLAVYFVLAASVDESTQEAVVSIKSFGRVLGMGVKRLRQGVRVLEELGLVHVERRSGRASRFRLLPVKDRRVGDGS